MKIENTIYVLENAKALEEYMVEEWNLARSHVSATSQAAPVKESNESEFSS